MGFSPFHKSLNISLLLISLVLNTCLVVEFLCCLFVYFFPKPRPVTQSVEELPHEIFFFIPVIFEFCLELLTRRIYNEEWNIMSKSKPHGVTAANY